MNLPAFVQIKEVGPRDGLQNEKKIIETADKIKWIDALSETGLTYIEGSSFVHPKWMPALADAADVFAGIIRKQGVTYAALVPNQNGLERALMAGADEINVFLSASEAHSKSNINKSIAEALQTAQEVARTSTQVHKKVRGYISTVFGCPYEGTVSIDVVERICASLLEAGVYEISLGDTIGVANPLQVERVLQRLCKTFDPSVFALHFHNTYGMALANTVVGLQQGITTLDSSCGGLGGCPYAPGAAGNVATNDLVHMLHRMGIVTHVEEQALTKATHMIEQLGIHIPSQVYRAHEYQTESR